MCDQDPEALDNVLWTDETQFCRNGNINFHNTHYWSDRNPHWLRYRNHDVRWPVNVWSGIFRGHIIGPFFIEGNLTAERYTECVLNVVVAEPLPWWKPLAPMQHRRPSKTLQ